jgi:hypothetical protein
MKVAARIAAKNFLRRFVRHGRSARPWSPEALRWRRARPRRNAQMHRVGPPFVAQWFTQFHMHFAIAAASVRERAEKTRSIHHFAMERRSVRLIVDRPSASSVVILPLPDRPRASLVHRIVVQRAHSHREMMLRQSTLHLSFRRAERTTVTNLEFRQEPATRTTPHAAIEARGKAHSPPRPIAPVPPAIARAHRKTLVRTAREPEARPQLPPIRTPELAWRKPERSSPEAEPDRVSETAMRSFAQRPDTSFSNPPPQTAWQTQSVASGRPLALDSATVDRLAEDVIRRVERHIRIERERRGV